jgi:hypothetical protein
MARHAPGHDCDRVRTRGRQVCENVIEFDAATFERRPGKRVPWT